MIIKAKYLLAAPGEIVADTAVRVDGPRITEVGPGLEPAAGEDVLDFGLAAITPGLINAHAHLELEFCSGEIPYEGSFVDWLQSIRDRKKERGGKSTAFPKASMDSLLAAGCTTVVDHHTFDLDWESIEAHGLRHVPMREMFGFNDHAPDWTQLESLRRRSFAPHAPYTASIELALACYSLARGAGQPISFHLSEFAGEIDFIRDGKDPEITALLEAAGAMDPDFSGTGKSPIQLYAESGLLLSSYAVHVNYLAPNDLEFLRAYKPVVVYCPRSHAFFKHPDHPLPDYIKAGVPVALGTDSLASNDSLSPLNEAALVRERFPEVSAEDVFSAITINGLLPLGWDYLMGKVQPGRVADLAVFKLEDDPGPDFSRIFDAVVQRGGSELTLVDGVAAYRAQ